MLNKIKNEFKNKDILSLDQFDVSSLETLFKLTAQIKKGSYNHHYLEKKVITLLFVEPSTRTFSSFATAVKKLGGSTLEFQNPLTTSSMVKGESLQDSVKTLGCYSDLIIMRHPQKGAAQIAADALDIPFINAGDGVGEHPTQALLDLFTIKESVGKLESLKGLIAGDLLNGRTVHSLIKGLSLFKNNTVYLLSPKQLELSAEDYKTLSLKKIKLIKIESEKDIPLDCNFWYWTRVQKERFSDNNEYEKLRSRFTVTPELLKERASKNMILMHPLPRVNEIDERVDSDPRALYLSTQMKNGLFVRMALLSLII